MKKYLFLLSLVALFITSCCCNEDCQKQVKKDFGIQLYSARNLVGNAEKYAQNHDSVFKSLADAGYTTVEAANFDGQNFYGVTPEQFKEDLAKYGLRAISSHTSKGLTEEEYKTGDFSESLKWWDQAIIAHKAAGMKYIVVPSFKFPGTKEEMQRICEYFNAIGKKCFENGLGFGYHNHSFEFKKVEDEVYYDYLIKNTDPKYVFFQMDVYWAVMAQASPVDYFTAYPGRFKCLHIKDRCEIGQSGMVGFDAIFGASEIAGLQDYIVELEQSKAPNILDGISACADYLKAAPFVKESYSKE